MSLPVIVGDLTGSGPSGNSGIELMMYITSERKRVVEVHVYLAEQVCVGNIEVGIPCPGTTNFIRPPPL